MTSKTEDETADADETQATGGGSHLGPRTPGFLAVYVHYRLQGRPVWLRAPLLSAARAPGARRCSVRALGASRRAPRRRAWRPARTMRRVACPHTALHSFLGRYT